MNKKIANTIGGVLIFFLAASHSVANAEIKLMGDKFTWPQSFRVDMKSLLPHARTIRALDPNFEEDGITAFTGVGVKTLFDQAGISYETGITIIGADQYVGFLSKEQVSRDIALLAWEMNDQPLGQLKGGPLKIVFPDQAKVHGSCYTWYVETLIAGPMDRASLTVQIKGRETISYTREDLVPFAEKLNSSMFSIPQGCRNAFLDQQPDKIIYAVPFS
ncbi:MAG: molybdopterin-dependent oxidoreductase, partial [Proteobacteria bacterium]|nr:molybdopterin-dependent oxidoreductase [Pseudomonadota bacterium]